LFNDVDFCSEKKKALPRGRVRGRSTANRVCDSKKKIPLRQCQRGAHRKRGHFLRRLVRMSHFVCSKEKIMRIVRPPRVRRKKRQAPSLAKKWLKGSRLHTLQARDQGESVLRCANWGESRSATPPGLPKKKDKPSPSHRACPGGKKRPDCKSPRGELIWGGRLRN